MLPSPLLGLAAPAAPRQPCRFASAGPSSHLTVPFCGCCFRKHQPMGTAAGLWLPLFGLPAAAPVSLPILPCSYHWHRGLAEWMRRPVASPALLSTSALLALLQVAAEDAAPCDKAWPAHNALEACWLYLNAGHKAQHVPLITIGSLEAELRRKYPRCIHRLRHQ